MGGGRWAVGGGRWAMDESCIYVAIGRGMEP